jgi:hypothetical protein
LCRYRQGQHLLARDKDLAERAAKYRAVKQRLANAA